LGESSAEFFAGGSVKEKNEKPAPLQYCSVVVKICLQKRLSAERRNVPIPERGCCDLEASDCGKPHLKTAAHQKTICRLLERWRECPSRHKRGKKKKGSYEEWVGKKKV